MIDLLIYNDRNLIFASTATNIYNRFSFNLKFTASILSISNALVGIELLRTTRTLLLIMESSLSRIKCQVTLYRCNSSSFDLATAENIRVIIFCQRSGRTRSRNDLLHCSLFLFTLHHFSCYLRVILSFDVILTSLHGLFQQLLMSLIFRSLNRFESIPE